MSLRGAGLHGAFLSDYISLYAYIMIVADGDDFFAGNNVFWETHGIKHTKLWRSMPVNISHYLTIQGTAMNTEGAELRPDASRQTGSREFQTT